MTNDVAEPRGARLSQPQLSTPRSRPRITLIAKPNPHHPSRTHPRTSLQHVRTRGRSVQPQGVAARPSRPRCCLLTHLLTQFTAKSLNRQALKAGKDEQVEKAKVEKVSQAHLEIVDFWLSPSPGHEAGPQRHCTNPRPKCRPQADREAESPATILPRRCRCWPGPNRSYHAPGHRKHAEGCEEHGCGYEIDEP